MTHGHGGEPLTPVEEHLAEILATITPRTRLVTHLDAPRDKIETALRAFGDYPNWES